jgi:hypothetical protein
MLLSEVYPVPIAASLGLVAIILTISVAASLLWPPSPDSRCHSDASSSAD